jgi:hypothetical protein
MPDDLAVLTMPGMDYKTKQRCLRRIEQVK